MEHRVNASSVKTRKTRRSGKAIYAMASAALCGLLLTGCSGGTDAQTETETGAAGAADTVVPKESGVVSLKVWTQDEELVQEMVDNFKQEYAGQAEFDILVENSTEAETKNTVLGDIHNAADVFIFPDDQLLSLVAGGALEKVPDAEEIKKVNLEGAVEAATLLDSLWAYPLTADNGYFLYYDKRYLSASDVQSLDSILQVAEENEKKFSMIVDSGWYMYTFFGNTGLEFGLNDDGVTNYCNWNTTTGDIRGVDIVRALSNIMDHPGFQAAYEADDVMPGVQDGTVIACISGVWNESGIKAAWGNNYGAVKLPTYTCAGKQVQMSSFVGYKLMGVNANSEHVEWACKLAEWLSNEKNQLLRIERNSQGPSNINAASSDALNQIPAIQAVVAQSEYGVLQRVGTNYWVPFSEFGKNLAEGNPAGSSPQELIDTLVAGITASTVN